MAKDKKHVLEDAKIKARGKWVLVKPIPKESKKTSSGLVRPDNSEEEQKAAGTVVNLGGDVSGLEDGDKVLYGVFAGEKVEVFEKEKPVEYVLLLDEDIIAFIR